MSDRFIFTPTVLSGVFAVRRNPRHDTRGYLERLFAPEDFSFASLGGSIQQINHTLTRQVGAVRGLHFQNLLHAETKLVTCLRGEVFDVAVDLRKDSPTFLQWHGEILSSKNFTSLLIPEGFAHGFQALSDDCELLYLHSASYCQEAEGGISPTELRIGIRWPREITELSPRDASHPPLDITFSGLTV